MTDELRVQRTITVKIKGPETLVDALAERVMIESPIMVSDNGEGHVRWSVQCQKDYLDADWNIIPPEAILAAIREAKTHQSI